MKPLENVLFGCTFWSVFSSPDRGYRPVRFTLSTNLTAHIVGTVVLGVPATSPALQSGVRMGLWPIRTPPGCECRWSFESPPAVLWLGVTAPPWPNLTPDHPQSPWDPHGAILDPKIGLLGPKSPGFGAVFSMSTGQLPGLTIRLLSCLSALMRSLIEELIIIDLGVGLW